MKYIECVLSWWLRNCNEYGIDDQTAIKLHFNEHRPRTFIRTQFPFVLERKKDENDNDDWRLKIMNFDIVIFVKTTFELRHVQILGFISNGITFKSKWYNGKEENGDRDVDGDGKMNVKLFAIT